MPYGGLGNTQRVPPTLADWSSSVAARKSYGGIDPHQVAQNVNRTGQGQTIQVGSGPSGGTHTIYPSAGGGGYEQHKKNLQAGTTGTVAPGGLAPPPVANPNFSGGSGTNPDTGLPYGSSYSQGGLHLGDGSLAGKGDKTKLNAAIDAWAEENQMTVDENGRWVKRDEALYGAQAAEDTLGGATTAANEATQAATDESVRAIEDAAEASEEPLDPYSEAGQAALNMINDLTGVNGPEAQQVAMDAYQASPALAAKLQQTEDAMARQASATGQLGGGNLLKGLQENALTLHDQEFQQYLDNLNETAGGGLTAGRELAAMRFRRGQDIADITGRAGESISGNLYNTGILSSQRKFELGNILAEDAFKTSGELSDLELQRAEAITNYMSQGQQFVDGLMTGTLGAVSGAQMDWLKNMNAAEKEFASMIAGIWAENTNSGASDSGGSSLMGMLEGFIGGAEAGGKIAEIFA